MEHEAKNRIKSAKISKWYLSIAGYNFEVKYGAGADKHIANTLSRIGSVNESSSDTEFITIIFKSLGLTPYLGICTNRTKFHFLLYRILPNVQPTQTTFSKDPQ